MGEVMKNLVLILGLIGLVGCSKNMNSSGDGHVDPEERLDVRQKIELVPYQITAREADGSPSPHIPVIPKHEKFIQYLERRSVSLSDVEKSLIRADDESFKVYLDYSYQETGPSAVPGAYMVQTFIYGIEVHLADRVIEVSGGTTNVREAVYLRTAGSGYVDFTSNNHVYYSGGENFYIRSDARINTATGTHLYNNIDILISYAGSNDVVLSVKNSKTVSACENYIGSLLDQYCPFNF